MLETCDITNKDKLLAREQHYIDTLRPTLNMKNVVEPSCEHGYLNDRNCPTCRTKVYCPHGTLKAGCGKQKKICCIHVSENFCPCNKQNTDCIIHGGSKRCPCDKRKNRCSIHGGGSLCECGLVKYICDIHNPIKKCATNAT